MKRYNAVVGGVYDNSVMVEEKDGDWVWYEDVEAQCGEVKRQLDAYVDAFDCINEAMGFAQRAIADPDSIAVVDLPTESRNSEADIGLIAAAPELLEALEYAVNIYGRFGAVVNEPYHPGEWIEQANAAIAKARGEQP